MPCNTSVSGVHLLLDGAPSRSSAEIFSSKLAHCLLPGSPEGIFFAPQSPLPVCGGLICDQQFLARKIPQGGASVTSTPAAIPTASSTSVSVERPNNGSSCFQVGAPSSASVERFVCNSASSLSVTTPNSGSSGFQVGVPSSASVERALFDSAGCRLFFELDSCPDAAPCSPARQPIARKIPQGGAGVGSMFATSHRASAASDVVRKIPQGGAFDGSSYATTHRAPLSSASRGCMGLPAGASSSGSIEQAGLSAGSSVSLAPAKQSCRHLV